MAAKTSVRTPEIDLLLISDGAVGYDERSEIVNPRGCPRCREKRRHRVAVGLDGRAKVTAAIELRCGKPIWHALKIELRAGILVRLASREQTFTIKLGVAQRSDFIRPIHIGSIGSNGAEDRVLKLRRRRERTCIEGVRDVNRAGVDVGIAGQIARKGPSTVEKARLPILKHAIAAGRAATAALKRKAAQLGTTRDGLTNFYTIDVGKLARATRIGSVAEPHALVVAHFERGEDVPTTECLARRDRAP